MKAIEASFKRMKEKAEADLEETAKKIKEQLDTHKAAMAEITEYLKNHVQSKVPQAVANATIAAAPPGTSTAETAPEEHVRMHFYNDPVFQGLGVKQAEALAASFLILHQKMISQQPKKDVVAEGISDLSGEEEMIPVVAGGSIAKSAARRRQRRTPQLTEPGSYARAPQEKRGGDDIVDEPPAKALALPGQEDGNDDSLQH